MAKPFQTYVTAQGLQLSGGNTEFKAGEACAQAIASAVDKAKSPEVALRLVQALCADVKVSRAGEHPRLRTIADTLAQDQPAMVQNRRGKMARALAVAAAESVKADSFLAAVWASRVLLERAADRAEDRGIVADLLERARTSRLPQPPQRGRPSDAGWPDIEKSLAASGLTSGPLDALRLMNGRVGGSYNWVSRLDSELNELQRRQNLLWWAEAGWSALLHEELANVPATIRGVWMVEEYARLSNADRASESFLLRTLRHEGVPLDEERSRSAWVDSTNAALAGKKGTPTVPAALAALLREDPTGFPVAATLAGEKAQAGSDKRDGAGWYRELFRERQLVHRLYPPSAG